MFKRPVKVLGRLSRVIEYIEHDEVNSLFYLGEFITLYPKGTDPLLAFLNYLERDKLAKAELESLRELRNS